MKTLIMDKLLLTSKNLREGNQVLARYHKNESPNPAFFYIEATVKYCLSDGIVTNRHESIDYEFLKPITLTHEILTKKCGGKIKDNGYFFKINKFDRLALFEDDFDRGYAVFLKYYLTSDMGEYQIRNIKYLHEFQNLMWVLKGSDIKLKMN